MARAEALRELGRLLLEAAAMHREVSAANGACTEVRAFAGDDIMPPDLLFYTCGLGIMLIERRTRVVAGIPRTKEYVIKAFSKMVHDWCMIADTHHHEWNQHVCSAWHLLIVLQTALCTLRSGDAQRKAADGGRDDAHADEAECRR